MTITIDEVKKHLLDTIEDGIQQRDFDPRPYAQAYKALCEAEYVEADTSLMLHGHTGSATYH